MSILNAVTKTTASLAAAAAVALPMVVGAASDAEATSGYNVIVNSKTGQRYKSVQTISPPFFGKGANSERVGPGVDRTGIDNYNANGVRECRNQDIVAVHKQTMSSAQFNRVIKSLQTSGYVVARAIDDKSQGGGLSKDFAGSAVEWVFMRKGDCATRGAEGAKESKGRGRDSSPPSRGDTGSKGCNGCNSGRGGEGAGAGAGGVGGTGGAGTGGGGAGAGAGGVGGTGGAGTGGGGAGTGGGDGGGRGGGGSRASLDLPQLKQLPGYPRFTVV